MNRWYIVFLIALLFAGIKTIAQQGFYIPTDGKIFFKEDTATIFSNVLNYGNFGVGQAATVNFKAKVWKNDSLAVITDEVNNGKNSGGTVWFNGNDTMRQQIDGSYNFVTRLGPAFPYLQVDNEAGVELVNTTAKIRQGLVFTKGHVYLNENKLMLGEGHPAQITGYDSLRYVVTNGKQDGGYLLRENIKNTDGVVVFPVGSKENGYTPAAIRSNSDRGDDFYVAVYDSVKAGLFSGNDMTDTSVNKTWKVGKIYYPDLDEVELYLQHLVADEGTIFAAGRNQSYISQYTATGWDTGQPKVLPAPGYLTTGDTLQLSGVNSRVLGAKISSVSYFTKLAIAVEDSSQPMLALYGARMNNEQVLLNWTTENEINTKYFILQRRMANEDTYKDITTAESHASGALKTTQDNYSYVDNNSYEDMSYYRVIAVNKKDNAQSNTVAVPGALNFNPIIWPNPNNGHFYIDVKGYKLVANIVIWNDIGQEMRTIKADGSVIEVNDLSPGAYLVGFVTSDKKVLATKKVMVVE